MLRSLVQTRGTGAGNLGVGLETRGDRAGQGRWVRQVGLAVLPGTDYRRGVEPIPLILLTGFLGAGKTTLLLRWLSEAPSTGRRMGVVMNEFGAESVDTQLIQRPDLPLQQVAGGCICCADDNELANAVTRLVKEGSCDYLVLETSGLADPDNVIDQLTDPELLPQVRLQTLVTVVDAPWFHQPESGIEERVLARRQIQFAQVVCLSKCDRLDAAALESVQAEVLRVNPSATVVKLPWDLPDPGQLLRGSAAQTELAWPGLETTTVAPDRKHLHQAYRSLTWRFPVPVDRSRFEAFLASLDPREVVRAKGFVRFTHRPEQLHLFQTVWGHHIIEAFPMTPAPDPVAVLIGPQLDLEKLRLRLRTLAFGSGATSLSLASAAPVPPR